jgi:pyruvate carboxylase
VYARVSTYAFTATDVHVSAEPFRAAIAAIQDIEGLEDAYLLVDEDTGAALTLTMWRDHQSLEASRVRASRLRTDAAREVGATIVATTEYRVLARAATPAPH